MARVPLDLTVWYLNQRRVSELIGSDCVVKIGNSVSKADSHLAKLATQSAYKESVVRILNSGRVDNLNYLIEKNEVKVGSYFTLHDRFYFKGLNEISRNGLDWRSETPAIGHSKIKNSCTYEKLEFSFFSEHLTSTSSWHELSGNKKILFFGLVTDIKGTTIVAKPYCISSFAMNLLDFDNFSCAWQNNLETYVDAIGSFEKVRDFKIRKSPEQLKVLKNIKELEVKTAFADIIGEPYIQKDWAGEKSDLFTTRVTYSGERISTAFMFKGPSVFKPLTPALLGKNGDQIGRLFTEPAELVILQHCHRVESSVHDQMRAFAERIHSRRLFCIIDGYDTYRILKSYNKCGL